MCEILFLTILGCYNPLQPSNIQLINCIFPIIVIIEFYVDVHTNSFRVSCCKLRVVSNILFKFISFLEVLMLEQFLCLCVLQALLFVLVPFVQLFVYHMRFL